MAIIQRAGHHSAENITRQPSKSQREREEDDDEEEEKKKKRGSHPTRA